jgi:hypothetical protein
MMMNSLSRICVRRTASAAVATTVRQQQQQQLVRKAWLSSGNITVRKDKMAVGVCATTVKSLL